MLKKHLLILASMVAFVLFFQFGCDDKSLTDTDFYDEDSDKLFDVPDCVMPNPAKLIGDEDQDEHFQSPSNKMALNMNSMKDTTLYLPTDYNFEICWSNRQSRQLQLSYALPIASNVLITIIDPSGNILKTVVDERQQCAYYTCSWTATSTGYFKASINAGQYHKSYWFEI